MWISNTATTLMLLPIAIAVLDQSKDDSLTIPLLLGVCYAASIGGMGTPIGTPPNAAFVSIYHDYTGRDTGFLDWMKIGIPLVVLLLPVAGFWLTRKLKSEEEVQLPGLGKWRQVEIRTMIIFALIALAWMTRKGPGGGWSQMLGLETASDADVAIIGAVLLFLIPSGEKKGEKLMDWETAVKIPWGILLLFSGGLVIASAFKDSGLSSAVGSQLANLTDIHPYLLMLLTCLGVTFLTEFTSNTASTLLLLPIIAETVQKSGVFPDIAMLMVPATISASCAFMMPVATAPNAIIYGSRRVPISRMAREGFALNIVFAFIISTYFYFYYI
jgi:sodium-dependent dicarboxylate transporter 2/3/5